MTPAMSQPKIDVRIGYEPGGRIGADYNRIMRESVHDWVLFLDHDVLMLHPSWYEVCQRAIDQHKDAGIFTCWANNIACKHQKDLGAPSGHDITAHRQRARQLWDKHGFSCTVNKRWLIAGFMMLVSKAAWASTGGFPETGFFGVDNEFDRRMRRVRFKTYRIDGLYCYHIRDRDGDAWIKGVPTAAILARKRTPEEINRSTRRRPTLPPSPRVLYTVVTAGYDKMHRPPAADGWDCVCLTDDPNLDAPGWIVRTFDADGLGSRQASRMPKILPHKFFSNHVFSVYLDASMKIRVTPTRIAQRAEWPEFCSVRHPWRNDVYEELLQCAALHKTSAEKAEAEAARYRLEGVLPNLGLYENGCLMRRHNQPRAKAIAEAWWKAYLESESSRDQPCLPVALHRLGERIDTISATERSRFIRLHAHGMTV